MKLFIYLYYRYLHKLFFIFPMTLINPSQEFWSNTAKALRLNDTQSKLSHLNTL